MAGMTWSNISRFQSAKEITHQLHDKWPGVPDLIETMIHGMWEDGLRSHTAAVEYNESADEPEACLALCTSCWALLCQQAQSRLQEPRHMSAAPHHARSRGNIINASRPMIW